jgi:uncharacterized membrane protein YqaE (UPF0057 family)
MRISTGKTPKKDEPNHSNILWPLTLTLSAIAILSFLALAVQLLRNPTANVEIFVNICFTTLGYIAGIITALMKPKR